MLYEAASTTGYNYSAGGGRLASTANRYTIAALETAAATGMAALGLGAHKLGSP